MEEVYLDANAGLPARAEAREAFLRVTTEAGANPASLHRAGRRAQGALERAREEVAGLLGVTSAELVFTSGATEACNLALFGLVHGLERLTGRNAALLASPTEHPAVLGPLRVLQAQGHRLRMLPVDAHGRVPEDALVEALAERDWDLVALQWANNETGAVQPIDALAERLGRDTLWHCDAVQGFGKLPIPSALERADSFVVSGHKFGAPQGIGAWVVRDGLALEAHAVGGGHQRGRRPGTETPALAAALAAALRCAVDERAEHAERWARWGSELLATLREAAPECVFHHPAASAQRLPNTYSVGFPGVDGRALLPALDAEGVYVSSGSACSSGSPEPSAVLLASGVTEALARASLRISFPPGGDDASLRRAFSTMASVVARAYDLANR